jgi:hypothetical protein
VKDDALGLCPGTTSPPTPAGDAGEYAEVYVTGCEP